MFIDDRDSTVNSVSPDAGAGLDMKDVTAGEAMIAASAVVGLGVLGTSLIISAYAAPAPVIGGTAVALGLGIGATLVDDKLNDEIEKTEGKRMPHQQDKTAKKTKAKTEVKSDAEPPAVTKFDGTEEEIENL